ncbi:MULTISPECIES: hypothetical protein [Peribacillus]|uniref:hypothetical protein n=1 Tax=Peribacillus TaxID=2675229 RepID=UPI000BA6F2D8|nr:MULTISPECIES: hypothetical protein [Peribacillus]MBD8591238.1 hypothetical protein [Peribacillus simplex]MCM3170358.1 hypothetical protein [Peribacillus frigoritolerans]MEE3955790.1 hypothetical protein [Peribacillus frigoritolerans]PAL14718.1 hypothetical protein B8W99_04650 [Peribacillus simplex]
MTALTLTIICTIFILGAATFLIFWTLENVQNEMLKTAGIIIFGFCFIITVVHLVVEAIMASI